LLILIAIIILSSYRQEETRRRRAPSTGGTAPCTEPGPGGSALAADHGGYCPGKAGGNGLEEENAQTQAFNLAFLLTLGQVVDSLRGPSLQADEPPL